MAGKIIIISAPSGCGKSTIIHALMDRGNVNLCFSVSATNRAPRPGETDGVSYHFLTDEEFRDKIASNEFIEYEEVYPGRFYGTLKSEIEQRIAKGDNVILDIDVKGGVNVKNLYGDLALSLFIQPPSVEALRSRLENRGTESREVIDERIGRAEYELTFIPKFDRTVVNDDLDRAITDTESILLEFIGQSDRK